MKLKELFQDCTCEIIGDAETPISSLAYDSRKVIPGSLFFCIEGTARDGNAFAPDAAANGASAIMTKKAHPDLEIPQVIVADDRRAMALAAAAFHDHPAKSMKMVGVTGTNGKTTTTYMVKHIAETAGLKVGLIGTIRNLIGDEAVHAERTTPESPDLQDLLARMRDAGCSLVVMEVSSHSLALDRTYGIDFDIGIFTNLTQDHLDFHGSFDAYLEAKCRLFEHSRRSLVNRDDPHWEKVLAHAAGSAFTYAIDHDADYRALDVDLEERGVSFAFQCPQTRLSLNVSIPGYFTVYNASASAACCQSLGIPGSVIEGALGTMPHVDGRIEVLDTGSLGCTVILDYAHTPDSLENVLRTIRGFARGEVHTVFGCGGNRDASKRPLMGAIAARFSDHLYVTSDNPRFEDPEAIIDDIMRGVPEGAPYVRIENRREAIAEALRRAGSGDVVLLAGKGHEDYQEICGVKHPFDEKVVVRELLEELKPRDDRGSRAGRRFT